MDHPETHLVTDDNGPRPAGEPSECFYCHQPVGEAHADDCVCRKRTVVVRATIDITVPVPESWDVDAIEFHRNESSWCAGNVVNDLNRCDRDEAQGCLCSVANFDYIREATVEDDAYFGLQKVTTDD